MSLEKAIAHGKEYRKPYYDSKAIAGECRNHGGCPHCTGNRLYSFGKQKQVAEQKLREYWQGDEQGFGKHGPSSFLLPLKRWKKFIDNLSPHMQYEVTVIY